LDYGLFSIAEEEKVHNDNYNYYKYDQEDKKDAFGGFVPTSNRYETYKDSGTDSGEHAINLENIVVPSNGIRNYVNQTENNNDHPIQIKEKIKNRKFNKDNYKNNRNGPNPTNGCSFDDPASHFELK